MKGQTKHLQLKGNRQVIVINQYDQSNKLGPNQNTRKFQQTYFKDHIKVRS